MAHKAKNKPAITFHNFRLAPGSRPQEGSSIKRRGGNPTSAIPTESLIWSDKNYTIRRNF